MGYHADLDAIGDQLVTTIKTVSDFSNRVYKQYSKSVTSYPSVFVFPERDENRAVGPKSTVHAFTFNVLILYKGSGAEADMDALSTLTGAVYDALVADRDLNNTARNIEIPEIDFSYEPLETFVFHESLLKVVVEKTRLI